MTLLMALLYAATIQRSLGTYKGPLGLRFTLLHDTYGRTAPLEYDE